MQPETLRVLRSYLPQSLHEITTVISINALLSLIKHYGGTRLRIPKIAIPSHHLAEAIGMDDFKNLVAQYRGEFLEVPRCIKLLALAKDIHILRDRRARLTYKQIALKYGMTERGIQKSLRRIEPHELKTWLAEIQAKITQ